jgi:hypothetical protein
MLATLCLSDSQGHAKSRIRRSSRAFHANTERCGSRGILALS